MKPLTPQQRDWLIEQLTMGFRKRAQDDDVGYIQCDDLEEIINQCTEDEND